MNSSEVDVQTLAVRIEKLEAAKGEGRLERHGHATVHDREVAEGLNSLYWAVTNA